MSMQTIELEATGLDFIDTQIKRWSKEDFATFAGFLGLKLIPVIELIERERDNDLRVVISYVVDLQIIDKPKSNKVCLAKIMAFLVHAIPEFQKMKGRSAAANNGLLLLLSSVTLAFDGFEKNEQEITKAIKTAIRAYMQTMEKIEERGASAEMQAIANQMSMITSFGMSADTAQEIARELKIQQAEKEKTSETAH